VFLLWWVISEGISFIESEDDERPQWAFVQSPKDCVHLWIDRASGLLLAGLRLVKLPGHGQVPFHVQLVGTFHKQEKTVILTKTKKERNSPAWPYWLHP